MVIISCCVFILLTLFGPIGTVNHYPLGRSLFLPNQDILNPNFDGKPIFETFKEDCYLSRKESRTEETRSRFHNTETFYKRLATVSGISAGLRGPYTMGVTLDIKTQDLSSGSVDVMGTSINIWTHVSSTELDPKCYKGPGSQIDDDLIKHLDNLPSEIAKPEYESSWIDYHIFLKTYGTHFVVKVHHGARITQWSFAKLETKYTDYELKVRSCADFEGLSQFGNLKLNPCAGVSKEQAEESMDLDMTSNLSLLGGTDKTRNLLRMTRSQELITEFLNEGRELKTPLDYSYFAIWDVLMLKFYNEPKRRAIALNMKQYYEGLKEFGCSFIKGKMGVLKDKPLRSFRLKRIDHKEIPFYECRLERQGCHSDADCHIGGAGSVTYCYGPSCVEYVPPPFGSTAEFVKIRKKKSGTYNKGVNRSCYYAVPAQGKCDQTKFTDEIIWQYNNSYVAMLESYNLAFPVFKTFSNEQYPPKRAKIKL